MFVFVLLGLEWTGQSCIGLIHPGGERDADGYRRTVKGGYTTNENSTHATKMTASSFVVLFLSSFRKRGTRRVGTTASSSFSISLFLREKRRRKSMNNHTTIRFTVLGGEGLGHRLLLHGFRV